MKRKAGIFAAGMILAVLIFMATAWHTFSTTNKKISVGIETLPTLTNFYDEQDRFSIYIKESSKLAASQALYNLAKDAAIDKNKELCRIEPQTGYIIWDSSCKPELSFIKQKFLQNYNKSFNEFIQKYPNANLRPTYINEFDETTAKNKEIKSTALPIIFQSIEKGTFAVYNFSYVIETSTKINLTEQNIYLEDFEEIYNKIIEEKAKCQTLDVDCFKNLNFDRWNFDVERQGSYIIFKFKTKAIYFFQETSIERYAPIELNFAI
ncbi:MAG: hypothetical protein QW625_02835 [Candidatus Nanoarchaeia archaeon]